MIGQRNLAPERGPSVWPRRSGLRLNRRFVRGLSGGLLAATGTVMAALGASLLRHAWRSRPAGAGGEPDEVGLQSAESFPASDAPSSTPVTGVGRAAKRAADDAPAWETKEVLGGSGGVHVEERTTVARPAAEVYAFWRHLPNLPRFMSSVESVTASGDGKRSHWVARGPIGTRLEWDAEVINDVPGRLIGWRTVDGADVVSAGSVTFVPSPDGRTTEVRVRMQYEPPAGPFGQALAALVGADPARQVAEDLRTLKKLLEVRKRP